MTNELFTALYDSLKKKLELDRQDETTTRDVCVIPKALGVQQASMILCEAVAQGSAMYDSYYPLDEATYHHVLPRYGITRFNQTSLFNNQMENRLRRHLVCGLDQRDGVCCMHACMTLCEPPDDPQETIERLIYFMDIFASCLGVSPKPVSLTRHDAKQEKEDGRSEKR
jgi:hypothetical protein